MSSAVYAHTVPIYIDVAGKTSHSREDALFFLKWIDELHADAELRRHVDEQLDAARRVYARIAKEGN